MLSNFLSITVFFHLTPSWKNCSYNYLSLHFIIFTENECSAATKHVNAMTEIGEKETLGEATEEKQIPETQNEKAAQNEQETQNEDQKQVSITRPHFLKSRVAQMIRTASFVRNLKQKSQKTRNQWLLAQERELKIVSLPFPLF